MTTREAQVDNELSPGRRILPFWLCWLLIAIPFSTCCLLQAAFACDPSSGGNPSFCSNRSPILALSWLFPVGASLVVTTAITYGLRKSSATTSRLYFILGGQAILFAALPFAFLILLLIMTR